MAPYEFRAKRGPQSGNEHQIYQELCAAHSNIDRTVWHAHGWQDDPNETPEDDLFTRLLALNAERAHGPN